MDRVFLDANVLFSAAYAPEGCFLELWRRKGIRLVTSDYAVQEALRNLEAAKRKEQLQRLVGEMEIVPSRMADLPPDVPTAIQLPEKDWPILAAAVSARATHLLTGDRRHFGKYLGKRVRGVLIQLPAHYLRDLPRRPKGA